VPVISRFRGIIVTMYFTDHAPPHFHARKGPREVVVDSETGRTHGSFPLADLRHLEQWRKLHIAELHANWIRARSRQQLHPIDPL
jgi:hypothetical protein